MASRTNKKTKLTLNVLPTGATKTVNRSFQNWNPALTDDKALYYGTELGALSSDTLNNVTRTDTAILVAD